MKVLIPLLFLGLALQSTGPASAQSSLPRSTPEAEGVSSAAISVFLDSIARSRHEFHSFMFIRHGKVIAETWWAPYKPELRHTLYSLSKSFTATAVGFARAEGKLALTDKVISFFPDQLPATLSENQKALSVRDLLIMSAGQDPEPSAIGGDTNWVRRFLAYPIANKPGSVFLYNSLATYMLSAIVQKVTGQRVIDYLQPRLFDPLQIARPDWETDPKGINTGGWGLRLRTEDIAKFAQLFLQKGKWNGKQILPAGWAEEASTAHIIQHPNYPEAQRATSDWDQGYGYQMWRCKNNAFRGDGAFGQYAIVMPDQDAVIAITSETGDMQGELNLIWKILLPAMQKQKLAANKTGLASLQQKLKSRVLAVKPDSTRSQSFARISGRTYNMEPNSLGIKTMQFAAKGETASLKISTDSGKYDFAFSANRWEAGETAMPGPYLVGARNALAGLAPFKIASEYTWIDENTLELVQRYVESPHTRTFVCNFSGDAVSIAVKRSFNSTAAGATITLTGRQ